VSHSRNKTRLELFDPQAAEICRLRDLLDEIKRDNKVLVMERDRAWERIRQLEHALTTRRPTP
jgi:hypothetical protein